MEVVILLLFYYVVLCLIVTFFCSLTIMYHIFVLFSHMDYFVIVN